MATVAREVVPPANRLGRIVGRAHELAALQAGLADMLAGNTRLFLLTGEPGIGKSRLADEVARAAGAARALVLRGTCWEEGGALPYLPWRQVLRGWARGSPAHGKRRRPDPAVAHVAALVPELRRPSGDGAVSLRLSDESERLALFEAVGDVLATSAAQRPLAVVLEDLHAADHESLLLLRFLSHTYRDAHLLLVGTYRDVEAHAAPAVEAALSDIARAGTRLHLDGLALDEVTQLVEALAGTRPADEVAAAVHRHTEGNPLFVEEVVHALLSADGLEGVVAGEPLAIPTAVRSTISRRLGMLADDARQILSIAAVIGREFATPLVAEVAGIPPDRVDRAVRDAVGARMLVDGTATQRASFAHGLFRETLYQEIAPHERAVLHGRVAEAIERLAGGDVEATLSELAHHWHAAVPAGADPRRAADCARRAGDDAFAARAYEEAAAHHERAVGLLERSQAAGSVVCEALLSLGEARSRAGEVEHARDAFLRAADLARTLPEPRLLARAALGYAAGETLFVGRVPDEHILELLDAALERLEAGDEDLRMRLLLRRALEGYWTEGVEAREAPSREALAIAERRGDPHLLLEALYGRCLATWGPDGVEERLALVDRLIELARAVGDREMAFLAHEARYRTLFQMGDVPGARLETTACAIRAEELNVPLYRDRVTIMRLFRMLYDGHLDECERGLQDEARRLALRREGGEHALHVLTTTAFLNLARGRFDEVVCAFVAVADEVAVPSLRPMLLRVLCETHPERARAEYARAAATNFEYPKGEAWLVTALAGLACGYLREHRHAARLYERLEPYRDRLIAGGIGACWGSVAHSLGMLAALLGRWDDAIAHFEQAVETYLRVHVPYATVALRDFAQVLLERGAPGDRDRAVALAGQSLALMREIGAEGWIPSVERVLERARAAAGGRDAAELRRSRDGWTLAFDGDSCHLEDAKGLGYLAHLLGRPHEEWHVLDLVAVAEGHPAERSRRLTRRQAAEAGLSVGRLADAGAILDPQAKRAYHARLAELEDDRERLRAWGDTERVALLDQEIEALMHELGAAVGLAGRDRKTSSPAERARVNVTRCIKHAIAEITECCPPAGRHLAATVKTGQFCSYAPDPGAELRWQV